MKLVSAVILSATLAFSQTNRGSITGTVVDQSQAAMAGITVTVTNQGTIEGATGAFRGGASGIILQNYGTLLGAVELGTGSGVFSPPRMVLEDGTLASSTPAVVIRLVERDARRDRSRPGPEPIAAEFLQSARR